MELLRKIVEFHRQCDLIVIMGASGWHEPRWETTEELIHQLTQDPTFLSLGQDWDAELELLAQLIVIDRLVTGMEDCHPLFQRVEGPLTTLFPPTRRMGGMPTIMLEEIFDHFRLKYTSVEWLARAAKAVNDGERLPASLRQVHGARVQQVLLNLLHEKGQPWIW